MKKGNRIKIWTVIFWIIVWESIAILNSDNFLFVSISDILIRFTGLAGEDFFWTAIGSSSIRIFIGIFLSLLAGILLAPLAYRYEVIRDLLNPLLIAVKSVPVASFIIIALVFISSSNLSILISFLIGFPIIYTNLLNGMNGVDENLLEMAKVFKISNAKRYLYIFFPEMATDFKSGLNLAIGMCWKAGVAAEVIGIPDNTLGEALYISKLQLDTAGIMAFTLVIVIISIVFEKVILKALSVFTERVSG